MSKRFYAKGKLLLTSEYLVLHGAKALAVPLKKGQSLICTTKKEKGVLGWKAFHAGEIWFEASIQVSNLTIIQTSSKEKALKLISLLENCIDLNPDFVIELNIWDIRTDLEFNPDFGFGSSSTLISLLAQWARIDPMQLYFKVSNGSGFDLACASANSAILYQLTDGKPSIYPIDFQPAFAEKLWLVYQGRKQQSEESVARFLKNFSAHNIDTSFFSNLTEEILKSQTIEEFGTLLITHEKAISEMISLPSIGGLFNDFDGYAKSLGAWGGDFALLASERDASYVEDYLRSKQIDIYFRYKELVIS